MKQKMKDSGVAWIGEVPEGWKVGKFCYEFDFSKGLDITKDDLVEEGTSVISYGQIHSKQNCGTMLKSELLRKIPREKTLSRVSARLVKGDFVFADTSEDIEGSGNFVLVDVDKEVFAGYHTLIAHARQRRNSHFFAYLFQVPCWRSQIRRNVFGIKVFSITQRAFKQVSLLTPPLPEQQAIAAYLDRECEKIDALREKLEQQIADLTEYRKSVIAEAVTGKNEPGPKKPSGVEWIGEVPEGWKVGHLIQFLRSRISDGPHETPNLFETGIPFISVDDLNEGRNVNLSDVHRFISDVDYQRFSKKTILEDGDVLFTKAATIGKTAVVNNERFMVWSPVAIIKVKHEVYSSSFLYHVLNCEGLIEYCKVLGSRNTQVNVGMRELEKMKVPCPPIHKQSMIVARLDRICERIDKALAKCREQVHDLETYKKSLINECVTGKREVA